MNKDLFDKNEIANYIKNKGIAVSADFVVAYWREKEWKTLKGEPVKSISAAINSCNSLYIENKRREMRLKQSKNKADSLKEFIIYKEQLQSEEWKSFRDFIFTVKGKICENCGRTTKLQIHHKKYISGRKAWEYLPQDLMVLCEKCHKKIHDIL